MRMCVCVCVCSGGFARRMGGLLHNGVCLIVIVQVCVALFVYERTSVTQHDRNEAGGDLLLIRHTHSEPAGVSQVVKLCQCGCMVGDGCLILLVQDCVARFVCERTSVAQHDGTTETLLWF